MDKSLPHIDDLSPEQRADIEAARVAHDWEMFDIRFAEILNRFATSLRHGMRDHFTDKDASRIRRAIADSEATVMGVDGDVPIPFGPPVRMQENEAVKALIRRIAVANQTLLTKVGDRPAAVADSLNALSGEG